MPTNERISYYISAYAYWIKSYDYWKKRYDERIPDEQGLFDRPSILERMNHAKKKKEAADSRAKLEELVGCEIADLR